jgi:hypothetical protein
LCTVMVVWWNVSNFIKRFMNTFTVSCSRRKMQSSAACLCMCYSSLSPKNEAQIVSRMLALYSAVTPMVGHRDFIVFNHHESCNNNTVKISTVLWLVLSHFSPLVPCFFVILKFNLKIQILKSSRYIITFLCIR